MSSDIERRLASAAEALREYEVTERRVAELRVRIDETIGQVSALRARHASEQQDVTRLEGLSLTRVLASLRGARDDLLARERAEADAAAYRLAEAEARLAALRREQDAAHARLRQLSKAPSAYAAMLDEKEQHLRTSGDPRGARLLQLADERGRLTGELREVAEALAAARTAQDALAEVRRELGSASGWSTYDTFFGGGAFGSAMKHSRLDTAAQAAAHADRCLAVLRTELADVPGPPLTAPRLAVGGLTKFVDVWFDNIFTDLAVRERIKQAQENVDRSSQFVRDVQSGLEQRATHARATLAAIDARYDVTTTPPIPVRPAGAPTSWTITPSRTRSPKTSTTASVTTDTRRATISSASGRLNAASLMPNVTLGAGACAGAPPIPHRWDGRPINCTTAIFRAHSP